MATRRIDDIRKRRPLSPEGRKRVDDITRAMELEIALAELREMRGVTQAVGGILGPGDEARLRPRSFRR